jgi:hypothetical protein
MLITSNSVNDYFADRLTQLNCQETTKAYIVSILSKYKHAAFDYSGESLTLLYNEAQTSRDFVIFQNLADYIFFCESVFPKHLQGASKEYYHSLAQVSYYTCYRLINRQLDVYENLSDEFSSLTAKTRHIIQSI